LQPRDIGSDDLVDVGATSLAVGRDARADVGDRFAGGKSLGHVESAEDGGQFVSQLFPFARQQRVVEPESHMIFDDSQPFTSPVRRGVDHA
jgi:hypothetical protein